MRKAAVGLNDFERKIVKRLINDGFRNQDIQAQINLGRAATINFGRISGIKKDKNQSLASDDELARFRADKLLYDSRTGLHTARDERLVKGREAMLLAVRSFNDPTAFFKTEVFCVLSQIAWTYLLHDYFIKKGKKISTEDGRTVSLSEMIGWGDAPLTKGIKNNIKDMIQLRDKVEHRILGPADPLWYNLFQANCLNFDKIIRKICGDEKGLAGQLSLSLQFAQISAGHLAQLSSYDLPPEIEAFNAALQSSHTPAELNDIEYRFSVHYTIVAGTKGVAAINFVAPGTDEGKRIADILVKPVPSDDLYPYKPTIVARMVSCAIGKRFTVSDHTAAWKLAKIRPPNGKPDKKKTNSRFCTYNSAHKDYTYAAAWVEKLIADNQSKAKVNN